MERKTKTWLITGASSGFGAALGAEVLRRGDRAILGVRRLETVQGLVSSYPETALGVELDVERPASIERAVAEAVAWSPGIDVLVNNAGRGFHGAIEESSDAETRALFETNVFGLLAVTRAVLPHMRARRSGYVVNIGSVAGLAADAGTGIYAATKFAVEAISEAMQAELAPLGIKVTVVEPGPFRTRFNGTSISKAQAAIADYDATAAKRGALLRQSDGVQPGDPAKAAALICDLAELDNPPLHLLLGSVGLARARAKLEVMTGEFVAWEERSLATSFDGA